MAGKTILVVDENEASRNFLANLLRRKQYAKLEASSGREALIFAWRHTIKMTMPYMGGNFTLANNFNQPIITKYPRDTATFVLKDATESMIRLVHSLRHF